MTDKRDLLIPQQWENWGMAYPLIKLWSKSLFP